MADVIVFPFWEGEKPLPADFSAKLMEIERFTHEGKRALAVGLGPKKLFSPEHARRAAAAAVRWVRAKKFKAANFHVPAEHALSFCEGVWLANYSFSYQANPTPLIEKIIFTNAPPTPKLDALRATVQAVFATRDLVNGNADDVTPKHLADVVWKLARDEKSLKATIWDKKRLAAEKMGLILAVARGSNLDPHFLQLSYRGAPSAKDHTVLIGKGITFDTGGLCLKTADGMLTMKCDMAGAATVLHTVHLAAKLKLKINVTALVPATENSISASSYKPGDVYRSYSGKTVEINNTDAEGRLILADAISYAVKNLKPSRIIDVATLTGGVVIALGDDIAGLFTKNDKLASELLTASSASGDLLWRMPMHADYREALKSDIADIVHTGGKEGGCIKAALFLQEFADDVPFAHIDLAGPAFLPKPKHYHPTKATGYGVKLLLEFLRVQQ